MAEGAKCQTAQEGHRASGYWAFHNRLVVIRTMLAVFVTC